MVPSGPSTPIGGAQPITPSLMRSNSGMLGGQGGTMPSQGGFPSVVSSRTQFNNVSSLPNHSFGNGNLSPAINGGPRVGIDGGAENDPLSGMGNGMGFNASSSFVANNMANPSTSGQGQQFPSSSGNGMLPDHLQTQQLETQNFQHPQQSLQQFSANQQSQQQQYQSIRGALGGNGPVKLEPQATSDQLGSSQQLQALRGLGQVKLEQQQFQNMRNIGSVKMEPQHSDQSLFLQQQQQQQLMRQMSMPRQSPQAAAAAQLNLLQQQKILQLQQQHQQQLMKSLPQQRSQLQPQMSPQNMPIRSPLKSVYEPGMCAQRLTHYMYQQQHRPEDNNIEFWRKFVGEYFAPNAKKKWCVSMYGSGRQTTGVFPQDVWHCEICKRRPGRGFEATVEVLPRLFKIKYESGTLEELLYVDMPREYQNASGQIVLDYAKAIQESVFEHLRVVRDGQLRIVFSPELKICSWEFCARRHEELIPRRLLIPQVSQLGTAAQKYQASTQNSSSNVSVSELQINCNMFVSSARQLAKTLEVPLVNDLGYTKRYVRCLQISEVVNSMKDLIDYSRLTGAGPMESLAKFPRRTSTPSTLQEQNQQTDEQQQSQQAMAQNSNNNNDPGSGLGSGSGQAGVMQVPSTNGVAAVNNALSLPSPSTSHSNIPGLLQQNSMNSRQPNPITNGNGNGLYVGSSSSQMLSPAQLNPSPFQSPTPSSSNNPPQTSHVAVAGPTTNHLNSGNSQPTMSGEVDTNDPHSSVQKFIQEMMMDNQINGGVLPGMGSLRNDAKIGNFGLNMPNGPTNSNSSIGSGQFHGTGGGMGQTSLTNGFRVAMGNNNSMNGRVGIASMNHHQQHDLGNQMLSGLGSVNGFNGLQFDWKPSP
ncbi:hypothetical protein RND81_02G085800 [Saponaria officinalis]|uniref:Transcriptional corepressor SEUSS n=1 Tax=Saponaria officinalis TaxID=3572 RepID=A0AAW1MSE6_SAPOF